MKSKRDFRSGQASLLAAIFLVSTFVANAAAPVVSNVRASQRTNTHYVDIYYDVSDADTNSPLTVYVSVSADGGTTWNVPVFTTSGAVGPGVTLGSDRHIVWNAGTDWPGRFNNQCKVRIVADDGTAPGVPSGMAYIPGGTFNMGDTLGDAGAVSDERPVHTVFISSFFMDINLVSGQLWTDVKNWAAANGKGYAFENPGTNKAATHPVQTVNWRDAVKWCNARSERDGLTPCYYSDAGLTTIYKTGTGTPYVNWSTNGYRLPTEAEWEKAARGGLSGKRFPWGDLITHTNANYNSSSSYSYDVSSTRGYHPTYNDGTYPYTSPVGSFAANAYGLKDMAGNVWEWCWDWYDANWYSNDQAIQDNTRGPASGTSRLLRGGGWAFNADYSRCANRVSNSPSDAGDGFGFRCVRGL